MGPLSSQGDSTLSLCTPSSKLYDSWPLVIYFFQDELQSQCHSCGFLKCKELHCRIFLNFASLNSSSISNRSLFSHLFCDKLLHSTPCLSVHAILPPERTASEWCLWHGQALFPVGVLNWSLLQEGISFVEIMAEEKENINLILF